MRQQPGLDGLPIIRVAISGDDRLAHELARDGAREFISEHLVRSERDDDGPLRLRRARFRFLCCSAVVGVARRVGHGYKRFVLACNGFRSLFTSRSLFRTLSLCGAEGMASLDWSTADKSCVNSGVRRRGCRQR